MKIKQKKYYILHTIAGTYEAESLWTLFLEIIKHRFYHLKNHGKWMD